MPVKTIGLAGTNEPTIDDKGWVSPPNYDYAQFRRGVNRHPSAGRAWQSLVNVISGASYTLSVLDNSGKEVDVASEWGQYQLERWFDFLISNAIDYAFYGFQVCEYSISGRDDLDLYNKRYLKEIVFPYPENIIIQLKGNMYKTYMQTYPKEIYPVEGFTAHWVYGIIAHNNPYGSGIMNGLYDLMIDWAKVLDYLMEITRMYGWPKVIGQVPIAGTDNTTLQALMNTLADFWKNKGIIMIPQGPLGEKTDIKAVSPVTGALRDVIDVLHYLDKEIIIGMLGVARLFYDSKGEGGSYSLVEMQKSEADGIRKGLMQGIIPPLEKLFLHVLSFNFANISEVKIDFNYPEEVADRAHRALVEELIKKQDPALLAILDREKILDGANLNIKREDATIILDKLKDTENNNGSNAEVALNKRVTKEPKTQKELEKKLIETGSRAKGEKIIERKRALYNQMHNYQVEMQPKIIKRLKGAKSRDQFEDIVLAEYVKSAAYAERIFVKEHKNKPSISMEKKNAVLKDLPKQETNDFFHRIESGNNRLDVEDEVSGKEHGKARQRLRENGLKQVASQCVNAVTSWYQVLSASYGEDNGKA